MIDTRKDRSSVVESTVDCQRSWTRRAGLRDVRSLGCRVGDRPHGGQEVASYQRGLRRILPKSRIAVREATSTEATSSVLPTCMETRLENPWAAELLPDFGGILLVHRAES